VSNPPISKIGETYQGKLVVIVNEVTQSQAEYTAMAFRAGPNTTIVGSTTAGADGNISRIQLPGGLLTMISGIGIYYPDGTETQRVGIVPDIKVEPTIEGIKNGKDEVLEKAIEVINK
jgi:C-terminal processing protease CtpA/Prc